MTRNKQLDKFNSRAALWLGFLKNSEASLLLLKPTTTAWSISELYDHIIKVAVTYQIPNFKKSMTSERVVKGGKNMFGYLIFNSPILPRISIKMEKFPQELVTKFTPDNLAKEDIIIRFEQFIKDVNALAPIIKTATKKDKNFHPMFGTIVSEQWFRLIEIHMRHHEKQRKRLYKFVSNFDKNKLERN